MARGFESKDVEFQQAEAERSRQLAPALSPEARDRQAEIRTVELALVRARAEQQATTSPVRQQMLARAIADLERQLTDAADISR